ncbi:hypothetical protein LTR59_002002 [Friedmanniomyces endolithicus]|nr:hypothetical protein LTR94_010753 [Friedmanniomyces endolithicus]KAK0793176.1 hypothetical protein LTR38_009653 [Friedmanniomyces endolithicus]KAK0800938.1 hypothetical protein LTR75_008761 [Friedmanniomyces endolithicus]KAK0810991.1 hypothetical protein LTR59_002002 [Friedmanniomyces endolithicus]
MILLDANETVSDASVNAAPPATIVLLLSTTTAEALRPKMIKLPTSIGEEDELELELLGVEVTVSDELEVADEDVEVPDKAGEVVLPGTVTTGEEELDNEVRDVVEVVMDTLVDEIEVDEEPEVVTGKVVVF